MFTARVDIVQGYCDACVEFIVFRTTIVIEKYYSVGMEFIVVTATGDILQLLGVAFGIFCGYGYSRFGAMLLCCGC